MMRRKNIFVFTCLIISAFFAGCPDVNGQKYSFQLYSISSSTFTVLMSKDYGDINVFSFAKSQPESELIDWGRGLQIDYVRQKGRSLQLHKTDGIDWDESVNRLERNGRYALWWGNASFGYRFIYFSED